MCSGEEGRERGELKRYAPPSSAVREMSVKKKQMKKKMLFDIIRDFPFAIEGKILTANYS